MKEITDTDVVNVLKNDGVSNIDWKKLRKFENSHTVNLEEIRRELGESSWAVRIAYNEIFGGVLIQQQPGEGNRKHYHPDADENWVIIEGEWEWWIEGVGTKKVKRNDIVCVPKGVLHQIKCVGDKVGVRYAITKPDVKHTYQSDEHE
jgi:quercetin dioxygenase-like cupin family protein